MKVVNKDLPGFSKGEEIFNAVSHIVGGVFGIAALVLGIVFGIINQHNTLGILGIIIYGLSMVILYTMSSIYHFLRPNKAKKVFRVFDHCTIYLLIVGTYTPICLITMHNVKMGVIILIIEWVCAIIGIVLNAINMYTKTSKIISMLLYVIMGWCVIFVVKPLIDIWDKAGFIWLLAGGLSYTLGIIFFCCGKKAKYIHSIWHLFVLLGTILQFVSIFFYIIIK